MLAQAFVAFLEANYRPGCEYEDVSTSLLVLAPKLVGGK